MNDGAFNNEVLETSSDKADRSDTNTDDVA